MLELPTHRLQIPIQYSRWNVHQLLKALEVVELDPKR